MTTVDYRTKLTRTEIQRQKSKNYRECLRNSLLNILGGAKCTECGFNGMAALQFDHIYNDGAKDRKRFNSHNSFLKYYVTHEDEAKEKLQVLCANCNWMKRGEHYGWRFRSFRN